MTSPDDATPRPSYVIVWMASDVHWYIRGFRSDGSFYGTYNDNKARVGGNINGRISATHYAQIVCLIEQIRQNRPENPVESGTWKGVLGEGPLGTAEILLRCFESESPSLADKAMAELLEVLYPYVAVQCRRTAPAIGFSPRTWLLLSRLRWWYFYHPYRKFLPFLP